MNLPMRLVNLNNELQEALIGEEQEVLRQGGGAYGKTASALACSGCRRVAVRRGKINAFC